MGSKTLEYAVVVLFVAILVVGFGQRVWQTTSNVQPQLNNVLTQAQKGIK